MTWMMLVGTVAAADQAMIATTTGTSCGTPWLEEALPASGDGPVAPDTVVSLWFPNGPSCPAPVFQAAFVADGTGDPVPFTVVLADAALVQLVPDLPLAPGGYTVDVTTEAQAFSTTFEVGDADDVLPRVETVEVGELHLHRRCGDTFTGPSLDGTLVAPDGGRGALRTRVETDGVPGPWRTVWMLDPADVAVQVSEPVPSGLHEVCLAAEVLDEAGAVTASVGPVCFDQRVCPAPPPFGLSCASVPGGRTGAAVAALLAAMAFRRRR